MVNPILCWQGGKTKLKKRIIARMPPHKVYVEPFFGGGSVFFAKPPSRRSYINDKNAQLMRFYKAYARQGCKIVHTCKLPNSKKSFVRAKNGRSSCDFLGSVKMSYAGKRGTFSNMKRSDGSYGNGNKINKRSCQQQINLLRKAKITSIDFKKVMLAHDSKDTLHYLDPPYFETSMGAYAQDSHLLHPGEVCRMAKNMKGKVILSYNNHPEVRKHCKGLKFRKVDTIYEVQKSITGTGKKVKELLITNF